MFATRPFRRKDVRQILTIPSGDVAVAESSRGLFGIAARGSGETGGVAFDLVRGRRSDRASTYHSDQAAAVHAATIASTIQSFQTTDKQNG